MKLIEKSLLTIVKQSFEWSSYDQILLWKIINAHPASTFHTKENIIHCLCYMIATLSAIEESAEFLDGVFAYFKKYFGGLKEVDVEELGYVFNLGKPAGNHIYQLVSTMQPKQLTSLLQKMLDNFVNKQEAKKLGNTLEILSHFVEIEEKTKGNVISAMKEDKIFKMHLKGILQSAGNQISSKANQTLTGLLKS